MPKKVLFFLESLSGGGAEKVLTDIVKNLDKSKYDITVCTVTDEGVYQKDVEQVCNYRSFLKMEDFRAGIFSKILFWLRLKMIYILPVSLVYRIFFREKYDVEVAFIEGFATKLIAASNNAESKKLAWVHTDMEKHTYADSYYKSIEYEKSAYEKYDNILAVSGSVGDAFSRKFGLDSKVSVQLNPVDDKAIREKSREEIELTSAEYPVLGTVGRLEQVKGYMRLLECAKKLKDENLPFSIWIIGGGTQRSEMEEYINSNGLSDNVKLLGFHSNPYKYLSKCDAFVCSSYAEGFSTAATESLILGKPIFTVECAGMKELLGRENCGEIVPNTDESLYEMLRELVSHPEKLSEYAKSAEKRSNDFKIDTRIEEIEELIG